MTLRFLLAAVPAVFLCAQAHAADELADIACETSATAGTGTLDLDGALAGGYLGFAAAGVTNGASVPYTIENGAQLETGWGVFTDANPDTLTRVADWSTDGQGAELSLSGTSTVCIGPVSSLFSNVAGWLRTPSSANLATSVTDETGTGALVFGTAPDLTISPATEANIDSALAGKETLWIPAAAMQPLNSGGCLFGAASPPGMALPLMVCSNFADEAATFNLTMPKSWDEGTITFQYYWAYLSSSGTVAIEVRCGSFGDSDALGSAGYGTPVEVIDTALATTDIQISPVSAAVTVANTAEGELMICEMLRDVSADTLASAALIAGLKIIYTTDTTNDD